MHKDRLKSRTKRRLVPHSTPTPSMVGSSSNNPNSGKRHLQATAVWAHKRRVDTRMPADYIGIPSTRVEIPSKIIGR